MNDDEREAFYDDVDTGSGTANKLLNILIAVCIIIIIYCGGRVGLKLWEYYTENHDYMAVRDAFIDVDWTDDTVASTDNPVNTDIPEEDTTEGSELTIADLYYKINSVDHDGLNAANEDYIGWIYFEDGGVSYPVMKGSEYIHLNLYGETTSSGSIFIDDDASSDFSDTLTFIYGHNMYNMSMFGTLKTLYNDINNLQTPYFFIEREDGTILSYYVFAIVKTTYDSGLYRIPSDETYDTYLSDIFESCSYYRDCEELSNHNNIVALSTCYGASGTNNRVIIYGVQI